MSFNITPVASGYQEIHPYSAMHIDSVKINTSLIMMKECLAPLMPKKSSQIEEKNPLKLRKSLQIKKMHVNWENPQKIVKLLACHNFPILLHGRIVEKSCDRELNCQMKARSIWLIWHTKTSLLPVTTFIYVTFKHLCHFYQAEYD